MVAFLGSRTISIVQLLQLVAFAQFCIDASTANPSANCVNNKDFVVTVGKNKDIEKKCKAYLGKFNSQRLKTACKETVEVPLLGEVVVEDACPAVCKPNECCTYNTNFVANVTKGLLGCKQLFGKKKMKSREKVRKTCDRTVKTTKLGEVVVKNECAGYCNSGCVEVMKCDDKSLKHNFILKKGEDPLTCESYLGPKSEELQKKFCGRSVFYKGRKKSLKNICPNFCKGTCKNL